MAEKWTGKYFDPEKIRHPRIWSETYLFHRENSKTIEKIKKRCKGKLLDVGAGSAPYKAIIYPYVKKYITLDFFKSPNSKVDYVASAYKLPFKNNSFDTVLCTQVLEHLEYPQVAIDEMYRVLKQGGILILSTHMAMVLHGEPYDYFRFTKYGLKDVLLKRFKKVEIIVNGGAVYFICQIFSWAFFYKIFFPLNKIFIIFFNILGVMLDGILYSDFITNNYFIIGRK